jgi:hypothetical protein
LWQAARPVSLNFDWRGRDFVERSAKRYQLTLPVKLNDGAGFTRDISTSGIFFETEKAHSVGQTVGLTAKLDGATVSCEGSVVRVEEINGRFGVAVALTAYRFH